MVIEVGGIHASRWFAKDTLDDAKHTRLLLAAEYVFVLQVQKDAVVNFGGTPSVQVVDLLEFSTGLGKIVIVVGTRQNPLRMNKKNLGQNK